MARRPASALRSLDVFVVAHTHWDREWYHTAPRFRQRLAALVDALLRHAPAPERPFLLDGQAVVLEDVIALRPDLRAPLAQALQAGGLEAGPWYVLADELLPSGEALIRNLLAGRRVVRAFGAEPPPVCYSPDAFGHAAALPALAAGFGLPVGIVWRGYGGPQWPEGDSFWWTAPDGSALLVWHLPPDGYEYGSALPTAPEAAEARWSRLRDVLASRARTDVVLCTSGADHHALPPDLDGAVAALAAAARGTGDTVRRSGLRAWADRFAEAARDRPDVPVVQGELRDSTGYTWSLQGTFATRAHQKRAVARIDRLLRHDVEPWVALAAQQVHGRATMTPRDGRPDAAMLPAWLRRTWTTFLRVLPHDTLCGCSVDAVARALEHRLDVVREEALGLREAALDALLARDPVAARARTAAQWQTRLVLRNRVPVPRAGLAEVVLTRTLGDVPVGPASAGARLMERAGEPPWPAGWLGQVLSTHRVFARRESPQHYPDNDLVEETRALLWVPASASVPGTGLRIIDPTAPETTAHDVTAPDAPASRHTGLADHPPAPVRLTRRGRTVVVDNGRLRLHVGPRGITLVDAATGHPCATRLEVTWQADHGDSYTPAPRGTERALRLERARLVQQGPLRTAVRLTFAGDVPHGTAPDERADARRPQSRRVAAPRRRLVVHVTLVLDADARELGVHVRGVDAAHDHALRLVVHTGLDTARHLADAAGWPVRRAAGVHPLHRWLALEADARGVLFVSDGLAEYSMHEDGRLAVTLVRATGELSRGQLPERPGHAGWPARIPEAQGPGRFAAQFAIGPLGADGPGEASARADAALLPLIGETWRDADATAPRLVPGVTLHGPAAVQPLAVLPADDGDGVVLRCVNLGDTGVQATWEVPWAGARALLVRLDESAVAASDARVVLGAVTSTDAEGDGSASRRTRIPLQLAPFSMATVRVR